MRKAPRPRRFPAAIHAAVGVCTLGLSLTIVLASSLPEAWRNWRYSRAIVPGATDQARMVSVVVPPDVYARAKAGLTDLRVIDDQGREVPYVLFARLGSTRRETRATRLLETSFTRGRFTQVVLDLGEKPPFHNAVTVVTPEQDFITWVEVAVSDDAQQWRIVRDRAAIFRFRTQMREGNQTLPYSDTNARYIRLRFLDDKKQFPVSQAQAAYDITEEAERAAMPVVLVPAQAAPRRNAWRADLGTANLPIAEVRFEVDQAEFNRSVRIQASADGESWTVEAAKEIYRFRQGDKLQEALRVSFGEVQGQRYWRVEVLNENDPPLAGARPALYTTPRHIVSRQEPGRSYRLLYGHSEAKAPHYELERLADRNGIENAVARTLGSEEVNTAFADPRPWTDQHPAVLWVALGIAVVLLAFSSLRALRDRA